MVKIPINFFCEKQSTVVLRCDCNLSLCYCRLPFVVNAFRTTGLRNFCSIDDMLMMTISFGFLRQNTMLKNFSPLCSCISHFLGGLFPKSFSGAYSNNNCLSGPARGVVGYQYTRYFAPKIPIYLIIVKCVILNT